MIEIETKIKVESLEEVSHRLSELGGRFQCEVNQQDSFFDDAKSSLVKSDRGLRIRKQVVEDKETVILTYKGKRQGGKFKSRREVEVEVADVAAATELLEALGYDKRLVFEKRRSLWRLDDCQVCLDELPILGKFVEVEGPDEERIENVLDKLKLSTMEHIDQSYAMLMRQGLIEIASDKREVFFG